MDSVTVIKCFLVEDSARVFYARIATHDATGAWTGNDGEGFFVKQADLTSITYAVYDEDSTTVSTPTASGTVTISTAIRDTPVPSREIWKDDPYGWNFSHLVAGTAFPTAHHRYRIVYTFTSTGGYSYTARFEGVAEGVIS